MEELELDIAYSVPGLGRFRCNVFQQRGTIGIVLRVIPVKVMNLDELGLPKHDVVMGEVPGRSGTLAVQGELCKGDEIGGA